MTPAELLVRLTRRPDVLADRAGLFDARHRDLDQIITWSVEPAVPNRPTASRRDSPS